MPRIDLKKGELGGAVFWRFGVDHEVFQCFVTIGKYVI